MTSKLPNYNGLHASTNKFQLHQKARKQDIVSKFKMKAYNDKKLKAKTSSLKIGDVVLLKWNRSSKSDSLFDPNPFKVVKVNGSMITVERNGSLLVRNSSFMKPFILPKEDINNEIFKDILFGDDSNEKSEPNDIKSKETHSDLKSGSTRMDYFETGDEDKLRLEEESRGSGESKEEEEKVDQRPKRLTRKPERFGNPIGYGTRPYTRKTDLV
ncbi:unnamed protein product [Brachionus calyciflorus]|uniref:Uncharacterized protein n=1 Tax=Brachionus calyciflorus TaxID=104777 RepID=A0A814SS91_9BILA|nr:unnamed protein product [Brachionus calyciflorus]